MCQDWEKLCWAKGRVSPVKKGLKSHTFHRGGNQSLGAVGLHQMMPSAPSREIWGPPQLSLGDGEIAKQPLNLVSPSVK
jgi:hypothetical protein